MNGAAAFRVVVTLCVYSLGADLGTRERLKCDAVKAELELIIGSVMMYAYIGPIGDRALSGQAFCRSVKKNNMIASSLSRAGDQSQGVHIGDGRECWRCKSLPCQTCQSNSFSAHSGFCGVDSNQPSLCNQDHGSAEAQHSQGYRASNRSELHRVQEE